MHIGGKYGFLLLTPVGTNKGLEHVDTIDELRYIDGPSACVPNCKPYVYQLHPCVPNENIRKLGLVRFQNYLYSLKRLILVINNLSF